MAIGRCLYKRQRSVYVILSKWHAWLLYAYGHLLCTITCDKTDTDWQICPIRCVLSCISQAEKQCTMCIHWQYRFQWIFKWFSPLGDEEDSADSVFWSLIGGGCRLCVLIWGGGCGHCVLNTDWWRRVQTLCSELWLEDGGCRLCDLIADWRRKVWTLSSDWWLEEEWLPANYPTYSYNTEHTHTHTTLKTYNERNLLGCSARERMSSADLMYCVQYWFNSCQCGIVRFLFRGLFAWLSLSAKKM